MRQSGNMHMPVVSHAYASRVTCKRQSCQMHTPGVPHAYASRVKCIRQSCHMHTPVVSDAYTSRVTCICQSCHMHTPVVSDAFQFIFLANPLLNSGHAICKCVGILLSFADSCTLIVQLMHRSI